LQDNHGGKHLARGSITGQLFQHKDVPTWRKAAAKIMGFSRICASVEHNPAFGQGKMLEETASTLRFATRMMKVPVGWKSPGT